MDADSCLAALARMGLASRSERPPVTPLAGGVSSDIVRVDLATGPVCIKRYSPKFGHLLIAETNLLLVGQESPEHMTGDAGLSVAMVRHRMSLTRVESPVGPSGGDSKQRSANSQRETKYETSVHVCLL